MISAKTFNHLSPRNRQHGAATLIITILLIVMGTLIIIFAANYGVMQEKISANLTRNAQAFEAAEAGLEFGINYLQKNATTIIGSPSGGYITPYSDSNTTNISFNNNSKFTVVYTNPVANNYYLIKITSTGTNSDGSSTRVVKQQVYMTSLLANPGTVTLVSKGAVSLTGNSQVNNYSTNKTITSASAVTISGNASTNVGSGGGSNASNINADITQNSSTYANMSQNDFLATYFGTNSTSNLKSQFAHYYSNSTSTNYSSTLNGMTGTSIWIDQTGGTTASISGFTSIGNSSNPVLIVVNGGLSISGTVTIYGFIFTIGTTSISTLLGIVNIYGGIATTDQFSMTGNSNITYNSSVLTNLQKNTNMSKWAKVPGSWKDF